MRWFNRSVNFSPVYHLHSFCKSKLKIQSLLHMRNRTSLLGSVGVLSACPWKLSQGRPRQQTLHHGLRVNKKREYAQRVREVEHGVFTPLVLSTTGGIGREAATFYKRLADEISTKEQKQYSVVMGWIRCIIPLFFLSLLKLYPILYPMEEGAYSKNK